MKKIDSFITPVSIFLFGCILCGCNHPNDSVRSTKNSFLKINTLLKKESEAERFSGTVTIGNKDLILYEGAFGIADRSWEIPMYIGFIFDIASINKSMISGLVMIAVEEGKLNLEDKLVDLLKNYSFSGTYNENISLYQLLNHTSGLPDYNALGPRLSANNFRAFKRMHFSNKEYVDFISQLAPIGIPGKQFHYSNFAYHLASIILEDTYEMPFGELLEKKILQPLNMQHTYSTTDNSKIPKRLARGYLYENGMWYEDPFIDLTLGRRVFSTADDLYKWGRTFSDTLFFSRESLAQITTNHLTTITDQFSYGFGWVVVKENEHFDMGDLQIDASYIIHGGSTDGYKSILININNGEWIISMLANSGNRTRELQLAQKIAQMLSETDN
jgi:CubicO group peptidase (beta-lactamase class C family)